MVRITAPLHIVWCKLPVIKLCFWPRNWLCILLLDAAAVLGLMMSSSGALAQTPGGTVVSGLQYPVDPNDEDRIGTPGEVEEDVKESFAQPGAIFPHLEIPGFQAYERFKVSTYELR